MYLSSERKHFFVSILVNESQTSNCQPQMKTKMLYLWRWLPLRSFFKCYHIHCFVFQISSATLWGVNGLYWIYKAINGQACLFEAQLKTTTAHARGKKAKQTLLNHPRGLLISIEAFIWKPLQKWHFCLSFKSGNFPLYLAEDFNFGLRTLTIVNLKLA